VERDADQEAEKWKAEKWGLGEVPLLPPPIGAR
jgi:hypothetical protein